MRATSPQSDGTKPQSAGPEKQEKAQGRTGRSERMKGHVVQHDMQGRQDQPHSGGTRSLSPSCLWSTCSSCCASAREQTGFPQQPRSRGTVGKGGPAGRNGGSPGASAGRGALMGLDKEST